MRFATSRRAPKYGNTITTAIDGRKFHSKKEARRYESLLIAQSAQEISQLKVQPTFRLEVNGQLICRYRADFIYRDHTLKAMVVEDVKGFRTKDYIIKSKLFQVLYPQYKFIET